MGGSPVNWDWEPFSLRAMSPGTCRGLTVLYFLIILFYICISLFISPFHPFDWLGPSYAWSEFMQFN